ncbi:uncharacterized protein Fot_52580 [Forsythia ovata]|uniref:Calmodulin-binding domain-containing protein n=1 Tax=Forsythia ovata TaxID=205694 RepID=A0ABD1PLZ7_9LAMI
MESSDSSSSYMKATSCSDSKKEKYPGGIECGDLNSVSSSTCGSAVNELPSIIPEIRIKNTTSSKTKPKEILNPRSIRRTAKSRNLKPSIRMSDDSITPQRPSFLEDSRASPNYLKATRCFEGKKSRFQASPQIPESSLDSSKNVRILIKKTSSKPERPSFKSSRVSEDVNVDNATCPSTLRDSKFPKHVVVDSQRSMKVCRYHHCSLNGHHHIHETRDTSPPPKRVSYKSRRTLKKQRSVKAKGESRPGLNHSRDKRKHHQNSQMVMDSLEEIYVKPKTRLLGDEYGGIQESVLVEIAFGETSYPEKSYRESLNQIRNYLAEEQDFPGAAFEIKGNCFKCSCKIGDGYNHENALDGGNSFDKKYYSAVFMDPNEQISTSSDDRTTIGREERGNEGSKKVSTTSLASDCQTSKDNNLELEQEFTTGFTNIGDSEAREVMKDTTSDSPYSEKCRPQFNKGRHISMWHLIHQQLASDFAAEAGDEKLNGTDGKNHVNGDNILLANVCSASCPNSPDSDMVAEKNESEIQEFELRKLFVIKLVREAIEKILLPEVQDQTSDDQSITSENILEQEIVGKNQGREMIVSTSMACAREIYIQHDPDDGEGEGRFDLTKKSLSGKSEKRAAKHWSYLKNWILLERFIKELVKVKKLNPKKLQLLPLKPDPEAEKFHLRPQTVDERKRAEEWMLDHALQQAVSQFASTEKRKVALLVKAFESVVPLPT